jgi:methylmalonyl-CoA/ethylmalonyl-CoA epimerase
VDLKREFFQTAWVVEDVSIAVRAWVTATGGGPFFVREHLELNDIKYRGEPANLDITVAIAMIGGMQIELIEQANDMPSAYREVFPVGQSGLHHIGGFSDDLESDMESYSRQGIAVATEGKFGGMRFVYFDTRPLIGCMTELVDNRNSGALRERMRAATAAAQMWDGSEPYRLLPGSAQPLPTEIGG